VFKSFFFTSFIYFGFWLSLQGQTAWTLNGNGSWGTAGNWSNGDPGSSSEAFFTNNLSAGTIAVNLVAGTKAKSITFGGTNNYTLNNGSLKLGTSGEGFTQDGSGSITINSELTLGVNKTFSGNGSGTVTVNGVISESGPARALTKAGSFTMVMTGNNTYAGGTILSNGILRVQGNNNALGTGGLTIYGGTNEVSGLTLANNINFSGGALRTIGTVASSLFGITTLTSNGTVIADADVTIGDAANELTGAGTLIKLGAERLIINMANNLSGGVWVKEGSLQVNNDAGAGTGTITMDGGTLLSTGNRTFTNNLSILSDSVFSGTGQSFTFNSTLATGVAGSTLRVTNTSGTGTQILAFGNALTLSNNFALSQNSSLRSSYSSGTPVQSFMGNISGAGTFQHLGVGGGTVILSGNNTFSGGSTLSSPGELILASPTALGIPGDLTVSAYSSTVGIRGTNVQMGNLTANSAATLRINETAAGTSDRFLTINGTVSGTATVSVGENTNSTGRLNLVLTSTNATHTAALNLDSGTAGSNPGTLIFSNTTGSQTYSGVISGSAGQVIKEGAGTAILSGTAANTFTNTSIVNGGTLALGKTAGINAVGGNIAVSNATLQLNAANQIANTASISLFNSSFKLNGNSETVAATTVEGGTTIIDFGTSASLFNAGTFNFGANNVSIYNWSGALYQTGGTDQFLINAGIGPLTNQITFYSDSGTTLIGPGIAASYAVGAGLFELIPIPEPSTYAGVIMGILILTSAIRRKHRALKSAV